jgi:hypothetical protein
MIKGGQNLSYGRASDRIVDRLRFPPGGDNTILAQEREVLGHSRVAQGKEFCQFADRAFALYQLTDN